MGEVAHLKQGRTPRREDYDDKTGSRIIKVKDYEDGGRVSLIPTGDRSFIKNKTNSLTKVESESVLILNAGHSSDVVGQKVGIVPRELDGAFYVAEITAVRADRELSEPYFLFGILMMPSIRERIRTLVKGGHLYVSQLKTLSIPLPPLPEQQEIARILQTVDEKIRAEQARKQALEVLFRTLLDNLMTGRIRVKDIIPPATEEAT